MNASDVGQAPGFAARAGQQGIVWALCLAGLLLPWINPFASGPSSSVDPWLFSAVCMAFVFALHPPARLRPVLALALIAPAAWALARSGVGMETLALTGACLVMLMAAGSASGAASASRFVDAIAWSWLLAAALSTALALCQYFRVEEALAPWVSASSLGEAYANLRQRNQFASLTAIGMAALFWLSPRARAFWPAGLAIAWLAVGNAATTSRTGLLQMLMLGALACAWPGPRRQRAGLWGVGLLAYAAAALALPALLEAFTGVPGNRLWERVAAVDACSSRTVLWSNVLHLIAQQPGLGWGWGELDYAHLATLYPGARFCDILDNAHNLPLHLSVELGVPFALLACVGLLWAAWRARPWREADPARQMAWAVLAVIGTHSLLEYPLWYGPFQIAAGLCVGLIWAAPAAPGAPVRPAMRAVGIVLPLLMAAGCAYAAWDYRRVSQIYLPPESRAPSVRDNPLPSVRQSWLFRSQARFAELTITPVTRANAAWSFETARAMLHYSPEPRVLEKLIESATVLGRENEVLLDLARFRAAFPKAYADWVKAQTKPAPAASQPAT